MRVCRRLAYHKSRMRRPGALSQPCVNATRRCDNTNRRISWPPALMVPGNPHATLQKALTIRRAALAPTDPSATDQAVAATATTLAAQAQQELLQVQSTGRLTTPRAGQAETQATAEQPSATPSTSAAPHVCGPNCQSHNPGGAPVASMTVALQPLVMATRALQSYQVAAQTFSG